MIPTQKAAHAAHGQQGRRSPRHMAGLLSSPLQASLASHTQFWCGWALWGGCTAGTPLSSTRHACSCCGCARTVAGCFKEAHSARASWGPARACAAAWSQKLGPAAGCRQGAGWQRSAPPRCSGCSAFSRPIRLCSRGGGGGDLCEQAGLAGAALHGRHARRRCARLRQAGRPAPALL